MTNPTTPSHNKRYSEIVRECLVSGLRGREFRAFCMTQLDRLDGFDWSGVYRLEGDELVLDAFVGAPTEHTRIPVGKGVCGTAIAEDRNQVVEDVTRLENYLACSLETKSEAVVLIKGGGATLGQIDVDGHQVGAFGDEEVALLEGLAALIAERWEPRVEP